MFLRNFRGNRNIAKDRPGERRAGRQTRRNADGRAKERRATRSLNASNDRAKRQRQIPEMMQHVRGKGQGAEAQEEDDGGRVGVGGHYQ